MHVQTDQRKKKIKINRERDKGKGHKSILNSEPTSGYIVVLNHSDTSVHFNDCSKEYNSTPTAVQWREYMVKQQQRQHFIVLQQSLRLTILFEKNALK